MSTEKLADRPQNKNFGARAGKEAGIQNGIRVRKVYEANPKLCLHCSKILPYEKRWNSFCNGSCSATHTNLERGKKSKKERPKRNFCAISFKVCSTCLEYFRVVKRGSNTFCSLLCYPNFIPKPNYRRRCKFKIDPIEHKVLFDKELVEKYGWYNPINVNGTTNLTGVCWDHLYRIEDGYQNKVPPKIMSHPANAELVPWEVNIGRKKSIITLEELYRRIKLWDSGERNLERFYGQ